MSRIQLSGGAGPAAICFAALSLQGCSDRMVTEIHAGQSGCEAGVKPWYVGREISRCRFEPAPGADRALIFSAGRRGAHPDYIDGSGWFDRDIVDVIKSCSSEDIHIERGWHGFRVVVRPSEKDRQTVECVQRNVRTSFSAGYGRADSPGPHEQPFKDLHRKAQ